jgi:hypothetical protein
LLPSNSIILQLFWFVRRQFLVILICLFDLGL